MLVGRITLAFIVAFLLTACGGGGGGGGSSSSGDEPDVSASQVDGLYLGQGNEAGFGTFTIVALVKDGLLQAISDTGVLYSGSLNLQESRKFSSSLVLYDEYDSMRYGTASMSGNYVGRDSISGDYSASTGATGSVSLSYVPEIYERPASLDLVSGSWRVNNLSTPTTVTFDQNGDIFGTDSNGCVFSGGVTIPDKSRNLYKVNLRIESCGEYNGAYSGLGSLVSESGSEDFIIIAANSNHGFGLDLIRQ